MHSGITQQNLNSRNARVLSTVSTGIPFEALNIETSTTPRLREYGKGGENRRIVGLFSNLKYFAVLLMNYSGKVLSYLNQSGGEIDVNRIETKASSNLKSRLPGL